jgi:DNA recombination protein RmuC
VVDAKAPFSAFLEAQDARDETERKQRLAAHAGHVRRHVEQLAAKQYWAALPCTPEFVVMFLPTEAFLYAAEDQDPSLWEFAARNNVLLATPTNLLTLLRTVALIWSQEEIAKNTQQVMEHGRELHKRLTTMADHFETLGKRISGAVEYYDKTIGSYSRSVLPSARRMAELGVPGATLEEPKPIEHTTRPVAATTTLARDDDRPI